MNQVNRSNFIKVERNSILYSINESEHTASIFSYSNANGDIIIPCSIYYESEEYVITSILSNAFNGAEFLHSIQFSDDSEIRTIEKDAFYRSSIEILSIPKSVTELKDEWCNETTKLTTIQVSPENPYFKFFEDKFLIGKTKPEQSNFDVLYFCSRNIKSVKIPEFIEVINTSAFDECIQLHDIEISSESRLKIIRKYAFTCSSIESITIPSSVSELQDLWCSETHKIKRINVDPENPFYKSYDDRFIIGKSNPEQENFDVLVFCSRNVDEVTIPDFIEIIGPSSFEQCIKLRSIKIPPKVKRICENAFHSCKQLKYVEIPSNSNLKTIENKAFYLSSIESFSFPESLIDLKDNWCERTKQLTNIFVSPNNPLYKFYDNKLIIGKSNPEQDNFDVLVFCLRNAEQVTIPNFVEIIGFNAFSECEKLRLIEIPSDSKLRIIQYHAFSYSSIGKITIPSTVTQICECAFHYCSELRHVEIPENSNLEIIGNDAFSYSMIRKIFIPRNVKKISDSAFMCCSELMKVTFSPDSELKIIENNGFCQTSISKIKIPPHLTIIAKNAFNSCFRLEKVIISENSELKIIEKDAFYESRIQSIFIPRGLTELNEGWCNKMGKLTDVIVSPENPRYTIYKEDFIIGKSTLNQENYDVLVFCYRDVSSVEIPSFIEIIGPYSFELCTNLQKVKIPNDSQIRIINRNAFAQSSIKKIKFPPHLTHIFEFAFSDCRNLKEIKIPENSELHTIEENVFAYSAVQSITFPSSLIELKNGWCNDAELLETITVMPNNPRYSSYENQFIIGKSSIEKENYDVLVFCNRNVETAFIPNFIKIIDTNSFEHCTNLRNVEIPFDSKLRIIEREAFFDSTIESITIPSNLVELKEGWCCDTPKLTKFIISPLNTHYINLDNNFIVCKKNIENKEYDFLSFARRNIEMVKIPSFIKIIEANSFEKCDKLQNIEFSDDSELQIIEKKAFSESSIESIIIPAHLTIIDDNAFNSCKNLYRIAFPTNSELQIIGKESFAFSSIESLSLPSSLNYINESAFGYCDKLIIIEIPDNTNLSEFDYSIFIGNENIIILISAKLNF